MSFYSRGCVPCRTRKVKCDEGRPMCQRCIDRGETCHGYPSESDLIWRDQNLVAERNVRRRQRPTQQPSIELALSTTIHASPSTITLQSSLPRTMPWLRLPIQPSFLPSLIEQAIAIFFSHHVLTTDSYTHIFSGYFEELPWMYQASLSDSALAKAVKAISLAQVSVKQDLPGAVELRKTAQSEYTAAISQLRSQIQDPAHVLDDATLMSILVLDQMEFYYRSDHLLPLGVHFQGICRVLQLRGQAQMFTSRGWALFRIAHHRILNRQMITFSQPMKESYDLVAFANPELPNVRNAVNALDAITLISTVHTTLQNLANQELTSASTTLQQHINQLTTLQQRMIDWASTVPEEWLPSAQDNSVLPAGEFAGLSFSRIHVFHDLWVAYQWNWHYASYIRLLDVLHGALHAVQTEQPLTTQSVTGNMIQNCDTAIVSAADDILASMPQLLGILDARGSYMPPSSDHIGAKQIGAYFATFPLQIITESQATTEAQTATAAELMEQIFSDRNLDII